MTQPPNPAVTLLPCPFCGGKAREYTVRALSGWTIDCANCGASAHESDPQRVRLHWNTRQSIPAAGVGEGLREAAQFLSDRLDGLEWMDDDLEATLRDFMGHVEPAHARLKSILEDLHARDALLLGGDAMRGEGE